MLRLPGQMLRIVTCIGSGYFLSERLHHIAVKESNLEKLSHHRRAVKEQLGQGEPCLDDEENNDDFFFWFHIDPAGHRITQK